MPLPDLIEIVPLDQPVQAQVTVPGSKSITNRALILAALSEGETILQGALWSEDTQVMVACLQELGFMVNLAPDPNEFCNRIITVYGKCGEVPPGGTKDQPLELFVGNAGTAARFLAALVCLGKGVYRLHGTSRMQERPQAELFAALRQLGYEVEAEAKNEKLPAKIFGGVANRVPTPQLRQCSVSIEGSSQFASALLLCAPTGGWMVNVEGDNAEESPYVALTSKLVGAFPAAGGVFQIEPDASSGTYFLAADRVIPKGTKTKRSAHIGSDRVLVANWPRSGWQIDEAFAEVVLKKMVFGDDCEAGGDAAAIALRESPGERRPEPVAISRQHDLGDGIMTAIVLAPLAKNPVRFTDLGRLRLQECERVAALRTELTRCGVKVIEEGDTLTVHPSEPHGAEIETYNDHRMAMCFAILGLKVPGIKIKNPSCVKKTFPNFFQKFTAPPPHGLGARILDGKTRRALTGDELFAG